MTTSRHWLCTTCQRQYDAEPLKCECGGREFVAVDVEPSEGGLGFKVETEIVERKR